MEHPGLYFSLEPVDIFDAKKAVDYLLYEFEGGHAVNEDI